MRLTPFHAWLVTFGISLVSIAAFPFVRAAAAAAACAHAAVFICGIFNIRLGFFCPALVRGPRKEKRIALTFDDGPDPELTPAILDILKEHGMKATFFVVGARAREFPGIVRRIRDDGHTVGCHDLHHGLSSNFRFTRRLVNDITDAREMVREITGTTPVLYRPPVGLSNPHLGRALGRLNMRCVGWSRRAGDAGNRNMRGILKIGGLGGPGDVVLLHDILPEPRYRGRILEQIDALCRRIGAEGLQAVSVEDMFGIGTNE